MIWDGSCRSGYTCATEFGVYELEALPNGRYLLHTPGGEIVSKSGKEWKRKQAKVMAQQDYNKRLLEG